MTLGILCGWEAGDTSECLTSSGTFSVQNTVTRGVWSGFALRINPTTTGTGSIRVSGQAATGANANLGFSSATLYTRIYFRADILPVSATGEEFLSWLDTGSSPKLFLRINSSGNIVAYKGDGTTLIATGTAVLTTGVWYRIEAAIGTGATGIVEWKVATGDGTATTDISTTNNFAALTNTASPRMGKVNNRNGDTVDFYYDDLLCSNSGYPGAGRCGILIPSANGNYQNFTIGAGSGSHYQQVDDVPHDSDTTYLVSDLNTAHAETEAMQDSSVLSISGTINAVKPGITVKRDGASNGSISLRHRSATTDTDLTALAIGASYSHISTILNTNPATGVAWLTGGVDGVEVGVLEQSASNKTRVTACYLMVDWTPTASGTVNTQNLAGSITLSGILTKAISKSLSGSVTGVGTLTKLTTKSLAGSLTSTGSLAKSTLKSLAGSITQSGNLSKSISKGLAGTITGSGTVDYSLAKELRGSITTVGTLQNQISKSLSGSITTSGVLAKLTTKELQGSISLSGDLFKTRFLSFASTITLVGNIVNLPSKTFIGTLIPSGTLTKEIDKTLDGSITLSGILTTLFIPSGTITQDSITGTVSISSLVSGEVTIRSLVSGKVILSSAIEGTAELN